MEKLEYVSCDLCGFDSAKEIYPASLNVNLQDSNFSVFGELGQHHRIVRCLSCDLVFSNPRDTRKGLNQKYAELSVEEYLTAKKSRALTSAKDARLVQNIANRVICLMLVAPQAFFFPNSRRVLNLLV